MASRDDIDRVKSAVNILDVVTPYVALKRAGSVWKGLCPFHSEKTPSFQVNPERGVWYCFGQCSTGGDIFKFLERVESLSFGEVLERLAARAGIALSASPRSTPEQVSRKESMYRAVDSAARYYEETLSRSPAAQQYLDDRGVSASTRKRFRLGYAGESFDGLAEYLRRSRIELQFAVEAGVLASSDREFAAPYDKMKGRIVCPIFDVHDRPIAFGGRLMADEPGRPKYLNTAETALFSKGKTFFAMSHARKSLSDSGCAVVVEGYFDVLSAHQAGIENVVATLGTSLTADHADILKRHVQRVVLAFDADAAGLKAAQRAHIVLEAKQFEVLVLDMPAGEDPDSLIRSGRVAEMRRAIDEAMPVREFQLRTILDLYLGRPDLGERDRSAIFRREIVPLLRATHSVIERERYIRMCAPLHPMFSDGSAGAEDEIRREVEGSAQQLRPAHLQTGRFNSAARMGAPRAPQIPISAPRSGIQASEENLLRILMGPDQEIADIVRQRCDESLFSTEPHRELARRLLSSLPACAQSTAMQAVESDEGDLASLAARLLADNSHAPMTAQIALDSVNRLRREQADTMEKALRSKADLGDEAAQRELMALLRRLHSGVAPERRSA